MTGSLLENERCCVALIPLMIYFNNILPTEEKTQGCNIGIGYGVIC